MFINNSLHYLCQFLSSFLLPLILLISIGLFFVSAYDLVTLAVFSGPGFLGSLGMPTFVAFADPWHVLLASGAVAFLLIVSSGFATT